MSRDGNAPIIEAEGLRVSEMTETQAHAYRSGPDVPETEDHMPRLGRLEETDDEPETEAHAALRISFPGETDEHTLTIVYRPPARPGDEPEVVLHKAYARSDARLKRDIRAV